MIEQGLCTVFLENCLKGQEDFSATSPYIYQIALYTANANLGPNTLIYTPDGEVTGGGYSQYGLPLTVIPPATSSGVAYVSFANVTWNPASFTARAALIYNGTNSTAVAVLDFGSDKTATGTFTITFPADTSSDAVIRLSQ